MPKGFSKNFAYRSLFKDYPDVVGTKDVCSMLCIGRKKVYALIKSGKLKTIPCSKAVKIPKLYVIDYILSNYSEDN